jgi:hypothetical protein
MTTTLEPSILYCSYDMAMEAILGTLSAQCQVLLEDSFSAVWEPRKFDVSKYQTKIQSWVSVLEGLEHVSTSYTKDLERMSLLLDELQDALARSEPIEQSGESMEAKYQYRVY